MGSRSEEVVTSAGTLRPFLPIALGREPSDQDDQVRGLRPRLVTGNEKPKGAWSRRKDWDVDRLRERGVMLFVGVSEDRARPNRLAGILVQSIPHTCVQTQLSDLAITLAL